MLIHILLLVLGFVFLIKGADIFVDGASSTAQNFKVSKMLIGLTIIAFGTSAPEFAVSMNALASGNTDMVLGNVIGSCITNSLLILGFAAVIHPVKVKVNTVRKELPLCLLFSTALVVLFLDIRLANGLANQISRSDGIIILLYFTIFLYYLISLTKHKKEIDGDEKPKFGIFKSLLYVVIGLLGIIFGSDLVVDNASGVAKILGLSDRLIALTIIAIGTSLPELVTTMVSSKKGEQDLLIGNIIGSNIFNICVVLGIPVVIYGAITPSSFHPVDLIMLVLSSLLLFVFAETNKTISKLQGFIMLAIYFIYYIVVFVI
ncbi:MAG: calcium/sodium antiporter [Bacilli bacterium]|nr:calcium/sodium antiporter [Bacilli bacterium]